MGTGVSGVILPVARPAFHSISAAMAPPATTSESSRIPTIVFIASNVLRTGDGHADIVLDAAQNLQQQHTIPDGRVEVLSRHQFFTIERQPLRRRAPPV